MPKTTDLPALTTVATGDLLHIIDDPSGSATSKKITVDNLLKALNLVGIGDANGVNFVPGSDTDCDLLSVTVTGSPVLNWDESESAFSMNLGLRITAGTLGVGLVTPAAKVHVDQSSSSGAIPVLSLDQADISDGFVNFIGGTAASAAGPISSWTAGNTIQGFYRVEINGVQRWTPYYDDPAS